MSLLLPIFMPILGMAESDSSFCQNALSNFRSFDVLALASDSNQTDRDAMYSSLTEGLKKIGTTTVSENESMLLDLFQSGVCAPLCCFSLEKTDHVLKLSLQVLAEVEVLGNRYKTVCPIWEETLYAPLSQEAYSKIASDMVHIFTQAYVAGNPKSQQPPIFHIRKSKGI